MPIVVVGILPNTGGLNQLEYVTIPLQLFIKAANDTIGQYIQETRYLNYIRIYVIWFCDLQHTFLEHRRFTFT